MDVVHKVIIITLMDYNHSMYRSEDFVLQVYTYFVTNFLGLVLNGPERGVCM